MSQNHEADVGILKATIDAIFDREIGHYPLGAIDKKIGVKTIRDKIDLELKDLHFATVDEAKQHLDQVKASYAEVKGATEYQDNKTARLLTIMAFLTAAAGTVFAKLVDKFPLQPITALSWQTYLVPSLYCAFALYLLMVVTGALISFYAMQTRFVTTKEAEVVSKEMRSFLFFKHITGTEPTVWAQSFLTTPRDLVTRAIKHYVVETYLIAFKASDKVRYLHPAQKLLQYAIKVLIAWVIILVVAAYEVPMQVQQPVAGNNAASR
jgi:hypothetical protein